MGGVFLLFDFFSVFQLLICQMNSFADVRKQQQQKNPNMLLPYCIPKEFVFCIEVVQ